MKRSVVITGTGAVTPLGTGVDALWDGWTAGAVGIADGVGGCVDFDATAFLERKEARRTDRVTHLALVAAAEALEQAGWTGGPPCDPERVGCIMGSGVGGIATTEESARRLFEGGRRSVSPLTIPMMMINAAPALIAMHHGLRGPTYSVVSACAAGGHAIGTAMRAIQVGDCDAVVTGGSEASLTALGLGAFEIMEATSPTGDSRPFDARRNGFVMGEGAGVLVLEAAETAAARGAVVLAELAGYGTTDDAFHITAPEPRGRAAARAIELALADARVTPAEVDYVNAHGTSTLLNDAAETTAIKRALGGHAATVPVSSLKSSIGHLIGAAGAVEAIATVCALRDRVAPPTLGYEEPDVGLDLDYVPRTARPLSVSGDRAVGLSNSFGFGGHNVVLCLAEAAA